jgi:Tol biopolymer transport system component
VLFTRIGPEGDTDIYLLDISSGTEHRLLRREGADGSPRFSPDGTRVAFHAQWGEESRIALVSADGTGLTWITSGGLHYQPTWSPDGRWLLFTGSSLDGSRRNDLFVVPASGGEARALVAGDADERTGSWGPAA